MRKIRQFFLTTLVLLGSALTSWAESEPYGGTPATPTTISGGEFDGYYAIGTAEELYGFAELVNGGTVGAKAVLTDDIVVNLNVPADGILNGATMHSWTPIGTIVKNFKGIFDGNGHTVSGLYFNNTTMSVGLIGYANEATIKNVGVIDSYIKGVSSVGGICGYCSSSATTITNCYNTGTVSGSSSYVGGICGGGGTQTNCYNTGMVSCSGYVGGICGYYGAQTNCYNTGTVSSTSSNVGGICGTNGTQTNCYYLAGCAKDGNNVVQYGVGNATIGETTADVAGKTISATTEEFASGKITYLLNDNTSGNNNTWRQTLGDGNDAFPVLDNHLIVYATQPCKSEFSNTPNVHKDHSATNGIGYCTACGQLIAPAPSMVTESDYSSLNLTADYIGYYIISNAADLYWFANEVNNGNTTINAVLTKDIEVNKTVLNAEGNLNGTPTYSWTPIGTSSKKYAGTFDGNNHTISGLYFYNTTDSNYPDGGNRVGLIGYANEATIKNIGVIDSYLHGCQYVGSICGYVYNSNTTITNCYNTGTVSGSSNYVGGICGYIYYTSNTNITNCYNTGTVSGKSYVGGICGIDGTLTNCYNTGTVRAYSNIAGGICGSDGTQTNCYNTGTVLGTIEKIGGICGERGTQTNCYNTGMVSGSSSVGGICGRYGTQTNCYNIGTTASSTGSSSVGGICGVDGTQTNCYYLAGCGSKNTLGTRVSAEEFASGKIAYLLNNSTSEGNLAWFQTLGSGGDVSPVLDNTHAVVHPCAFGAIEHPSMTATGYCTACGQFFAHGTLVDESNYSSLNLSADFIGYYAISNSGELYWLANEVNNGDTTINAVLTADIVVNENVLNADGNLNGTPTYSWTPIGTYDNKYKGTFDGNGHTISGLYFKNTTNSNYPDGGKYIGLIGYANGATIKNVGVIDSYFIGYYYVGGICGYKGTQTNCYNTGTVRATGRCAGGICGSGGTQTNCYNTGSVSGRNYGGICGNGGTQTNCYCLEGSSSSSGGGFFATAEEFASGKIVYLLNGSTSGNNNVWRQNLNGEDTDAFPVLDKTHTVVYATLPCLSFSNDANNTHKDHPSIMDVTGYCPTCGQFAVHGTLVTESNYSSLNLSADFVGYYAISKSAELYWFANEVNNGNNTINAVLTADIVVNENVLNNDGTLNGTPTYSWTPIGILKYGYAGTFDGNGHTVSGLYFNNATSGDYPDGGNHVGLIGRTDGATIKNVGVIGSYLKGHQWVGGICGVCSGSTTTTITNCYNTGTVSGGADVGGICGYYGTLENCYNTGAVTGSSYYVGGICGYYGAQTNCYNTGAVTGSSAYVGGICGINGAQTNCHNTGTVSGSYAVGGICGSSGVQDNCYYLAGCAKDGQPVVQNGVGNSTEGETTADVPGETTAATAEEFASGKIGYLLNTNNKKAWHQNLYSDGYPVLDNTHNFVSGYIEEDGDTYTVVGNAYLATNYEIAAGKTLNVPAGTSLTTTGNAVITNNGTLFANGTVAGNNLAGNGSYIFDQLAETDITFNKESYPYKRADYTLDDGLDVTIGHVMCGKTFTFDDSKTTVEYADNFYVGDATVTWTIANGSSVSKTFSITPKILTISNIKAKNKVYDGNTATTVSYDVDVFAGDNVTFGTAATFDNKNAGNGKTVSFNYTKSGDDANNYAFAKTSETTTTDIEQRELVISSTVAAGKVYDGNTATTVAIAASNIVNGDAVTFGTAAAFADKNVGTNKTVNFTYTKSGADAANYKFANTEATATANITARSLTLSNFKADSKTYDATTNATGGQFSDDRVSGDVLEFSYNYSFANKNVENGKDVNFSNIAISGGADKDNYTLAATTGAAKADITVKTLAISNIKAENKTYDGNTATTVSYTTDKVATDDVTFGTTATFADKNVGNGKAVSFNYTKSGADAANYAFANATGTTTANIEQRKLEFSSITAAGKVYDGNTATTVTIEASNIVNGDAVTFGTAAAFDNKNVGTNKTVNFTYTKSGADAANYKFANAEGTAKANITARELVLSNFAASNKVYDGTTSASGSFSDNRVSGDELEFSYDVEFDDENANTDVDIYFSNIAISGGTDKDNYYLDVDESEPKANADITPVTDEVVVTITMPTRTVVYNGQGNHYTVSSESDVISCNSELYFRKGSFGPVNNTVFQTYMQNIQLKTDAGEYILGWTAELFENTSPNFSNVTFN
ncbi:MAG: hypothetical protein J6T98_00275, partial [Salinivirgaceae bacterium]|nr:hypothetical protein [Salinivirgaceae bacterium]